MGCPNARAGVRAVKKRGASEQPGATQVSTPPSLITTSVVAVGVDLVVPTLVGMHISPNYTTSVVAVGVAVVTHQCWLGLPRFERKKRSWILLHPLLIFMSTHGIVQKKVSASSLPLCPSFPLLNPPFHFPNFNFPEIRTSFFVPDCLDIFAPASILL